MSEQWVWHYLFNSNATKTSIERLSDLSVRCILPNKVTGKDQTVDLAYDRRDQRALVAFDGYLLAGSPNHGGIRLTNLPIGKLTIPQAQFRRSDGLRLGYPFYYFGGEPGSRMVSLYLDRYFLLLRGGRFVFMGIDPKSFVSRYLIAEVRFNEKNRAVVNWTVAAD